MKWTKKAALCAIATTHLNKRGGADTPVQNNVFSWDATQQQNLKDELCTHLIKKLDMVNLGRA